MAATVLYRPKLHCRQDLFKTNVGGAQDSPAKLLRHGEIIKLERLECADKDLAAWFRLAHQRQYFHDLLGDGRAIPALDSNVLTLENTPYYFWAE